MKKPSAALLFFLVFITTGFGQYISIEGRQFKNGTNQFFPLVCNYLVEYIANGTSDDFFASPYSTYDGPLPGWGGYECDDIPTCNTQMSRNFTEIASMNFNAIRLISLQPYYCHSNDHSVPGFRISYYSVVNGHSTATKYAYLTKPYYDPTNQQYDPMTYKIFKNLKNILHTASQIQCAGSTLKVIFVCSNGIEDHNDIVSFNEDFTEFLDALSIFISTECTTEEKEALMAYDLMNEPMDMNNQAGWPGIIQNHTKQDVCEKVAKWYDVLKKNDPEHLVTLGAHNYSDVFEYDGSVMKLDFFSPHFYEGQKPYDATINIVQCNTTLSPLEQMEYRVFSNYYWAMTNWPLPYMIGETGFGATPNGNDGAMGTYSDQEDYAEKTLQKTLSYNCSGYSWWNYQDYIWPGLDRYNGLLTSALCNPPCATLEKPAVQKFKDFDPFVSVPIEGRPCNYYDIFNHVTYKETSPYKSIIDANTITGTVYQKHGSILTSVPVKNAVIFAVTLMPPTIYNPTQKHLDFFYTFSSEDNGTFTLIPYDWELDVIDGSMISINDLRISAPAASRLDVGWFTPGISIEKNGTYYLDQVTDNFYEEVFKDHLPVTSDISAKGWDKLTAYNDNYISSSGQQEMTARREIDLKAGQLPNHGDEFTISNGSNVHIYTTNTFFDCNLLQGIDGSKKMEIPDGKNNSVPTSLTLTFSKKKCEFDFSIIPNPNHGTFKIDVNDSDKTIQEYSVKIFNLLGVLIYQSNSNSKSFMINMSMERCGIYTVQLSSHSNNKSKKLVIN